MNTVKRSLETLHIKLLENKIINGETLYNVIENFNKNGVRSYQVTNLKFDTEDETVFFYDSEDKILKNQYTIMGFLIESIMNIQSNDTDQVNVTIQLSDGTIQLQQQ